MMCVYTSIKLTIKGKAPLLGQADTLLSSQLQSVLGHGGRGTGLAECATEMLLFRLKE